MRPRLSLRLVVLGAALALPGGLYAQSSEFRLDESGEWTQTAAPAAGSDEALIAEARRHLAEGRPSAARELLGPWISEHERPDHPLLPQAYLLRGDARTANGYEYKALYDYEKVIKGFPATPEFLTANERELEIAIRYVNGLERKWLGLRIMDAQGEGEELLIRVQERVPGSRLAERAGIELADYYYRNRDLRLAAEAYDLFVQNYPTSTYAMKAMQRRVYATIARFKGPRYDGSALLDAQVLIRRFASLYPSEAEHAGLNDALLTRLDESAGAERLETARWYLRTGDEASARLTLRRLVRDHPRTGAAGRALDLLAERGWDAPSEAPSAPRPRRRSRTPVPTAPLDTPPARADEPSVPPEEVPEINRQGPISPEQSGPGPRFVPGTPLRRPERGGKGDQGGGDER